MQDQGRQQQPIDRRDDDTDDGLGEIKPVLAEDLVADAESNSDGRRAEPELIHVPSTAAHQSVSGVVAAVISAVLILAAGLWAMFRPTTVNDIPLLRATDVIFWILAAAGILAAGIGAQFAELSARAGAVALGQRSTGRGTPFAWILPGCASAASILLIGTWHNLTVTLVGAVLTLASVIVALLVRDLFDDLTDSAVQVAVILHGVMIHVAAFIGLASLYLNKLPAWLTVPLVGLFAGLLILEALGRAPRTDSRRIGMAALGGLVLAQAAIAIERWPTWGWTGGITLLVTFFIANGLLVTWAVSRSVARRDVGYYAGLGAIGLALVALFAL